MLWGYVYITKHFKLEQMFWMSSTHRLPSKIQIISTKNPPQPALIFSSTLPSLHHSKLCQNYKQFIESLTKQFENQFEKTSQPQQKLNYQTIQFPIKPYKNTIPLSKKSYNFNQIPERNTKQKFPRQNHYSLPTKFPSLNLQKILQNQHFPLLPPSLTSSHSRASFQESYISK